MAHEEAHEKIKDGMLKILENEVIFNSITSEELEEVAEKCASQMINMISDTATSYLLHYIK